MLRQGAHSVLGPRPSVLVVYLTKCKVCDRAGTSSAGARQAIEIIIPCSASFREDSMSRGWMPRRCVPMKDVA